MTPVGPATESGPAVVPSAPTTAAERLEYLVRLVVESGNGVSPATWWLASLRERMSQAAQAWELEVGDAREEALEAIADLEIERDRLRAEVSEAREDRQGHEALSIAHDRIAQLEETVERLSVDLDEARQNAQAASERHAAESGLQRRTIAALVEQLAAEMRRGGGA